jgi:general secretion pathway protein B
MSFILDALKKSETDRQEQEPTEFANIPASSDSPGIPRWLWILGLLLAVNLIVLLGLLLRDGAGDIAAPVAEPIPTDTATPQATASFATQIDDVRERQPEAGSRPDPISGPVAAVPEPEPSPVVEAVRPDYTLRALPTVNELRANGTISIPELHLDIHVYSEAAADRFVFINMNRHRENSQLAEGPVVSEITPEGVILDYRGTVFLLPRE